MAVSITDIPTTEPSQIRAGDTAVWKRSLADYPATTWTLTYSLLSSSAKITITATASGADHYVEEAAATTSGWTAGKYDWTAHVASGTERYSVDSGRIEIQPDLAAASTYDARTHARKMLEAIESLLEGRATTDQLDTISASYDVRSLERDKGALLALRDKYRAEVRAEDQAEALANGEGSGRQIYVRFAE